MNGLSLLLLLCVHQEGLRAGSEDTKKLSDHDEMKADVPPELRSLWAELLGLKELVLSLKEAEEGQRQAQRSVETQLRDWQVDSEQQRRRLDQLEDALLHRAEEPLMEPGSSLRRRVENLEVQREGGSLKGPCGPFHGFIEQTLVQADTRGRSNGSSSGAGEPSQASHGCSEPSFSFLCLQRSSSNFRRCSVSAQAAEVSTLESRMNSSESFLEEQVKKSSGKPLPSQRRVRISKTNLTGPGERRPGAQNQPSCLVLLSSPVDISADLVTRTTTHSKPAFPDLL